jgi:hypothetical protein
MRRQVTVRFLNKTEGALRYREIDSTGAYIHNDHEGSLLGDVYVRKAVMPNEHPEQIKVTIEY